MISSGDVGGFHADRLLAILQDSPAVERGRRRVLVLDSDADAADVLRDQLAREDAEIVTASTVEGARERLADAPVALIVCDPALAADAAPRFLSQLTEHAARTGIPVIVLKRTAEIITDVEMYLLGVDAILGPPVQRSELVALVRSHLRKQSQARRSLLQDPVTGHPTVSLFREAYRRSASLAAREHEPLSLVVLHIGALDRIRREEGVEKASDILRGVAGGVFDTLRQSDLLARGSGDSLLLLLPNTDAAGAARVLEKVHHRLERSAALTTTPLSELRLSAGVVEAAPKVEFEQALEGALTSLRPLRSALERAFAPEQSPSPPPQRRILLAEDDALTTSIIRHRLQRLGHEVMHAADGDAVLRLVPDSHFSLLILDVKMPYVDGFEVLRRLRSIRPMRELPVMMVTSLGNEEDISRGFELGADDYLVKPFSPVELQARAQRLLR